MSKLRPKRFVWAFTLLGVAMTSHASAQQSAVRFHGATGVVRVGDAQCTMPCTLDLAPGRHEVRLSDKTFRLDVPRAGSVDAHYQMHVGWTGLVTGGAVIVAGFGVMVAGSILGGSTSNGLCTSQACSNTAMAFVLGSIGVMSVGGVIMLLGALATGYRFELATGPSTTSASVHPVVDGRGIGLAF